MSGHLVAIEMEPTPRALLRYNRTPTPRVQGNPRPCYTIVKDRP